MKTGDRLIVIADDNEYQGATGVMVGVTTQGRVVVQLDGADWEITFDPHDLEVLLELD